MTKDRVEVSNQEVMQAISGLSKRFDTVDAKLVAQDSHFGVIDKRLDAITLTTNKTLVAFNDRMDGMDARLGTIERKTTKIEMTVLDMQDDLTSALAAVDRDAEKSYDHEQRITKLEKTSD